MSDKDWTDLHVERWREHWIDVDFDDDVEAIVTRIARLARYLKGTVATALVETGLQDFEYDTLHALMIRDTPGVASPTELAEVLKVSAAGMTGRLDGLERAGWVQRAPSPEDRRRVIVEVTKAGVDVWRRTQGGRGAQEADLVEALTQRERELLNRLLRKLSLRAESE